MKADIWMPLYINAWLAGTTELEAEGQGIYLLLVLSIWKKGTLPRDISKLCRIARTDDEDLLQEILDDFFYPTDDGYSHHRVELEMKTARKNRETAAENGRKGGRPRKNNNPEKTHGLTQQKPMGYDRVNPEETDRVTETKPKGNPGHNPDETGGVTQTKAKPNPEKSPSPSPKDIKKKENFNKRKKKNENPVFSVDEVEEYRLELESHVEADVFFDYYQARGWMWRNTPIVDWKAVFRNWDRNLRKAQGTKTVSSTRPAEDHIGVDEDVPEDEIRKLLIAGGARVDETA